MTKIIKSLWFLSGIVQKNNHQAIIMDSYDEDLTENRFFIILQSKYKQLYESATSKKWTVSDQL